MGVAVGLAAGFVSTAAAAGIPDQVNDPQTGTSYGCGGAAALYQGFLPSRKQLAAVELRLRAGGSFPAQGVNFPVRIHRGGPAGEIIGSATASVAGPLAAFSAVR
jgi:hypothetical protein